MAGLEADLGPIGLDPRDLVTSATDSPRSGDVLYTFSNTPTRGAIGAFVMGSRNPDRVSLAARRAKCETVAQMIEQGWDVVSKWRRCELMMQVDLRVIAIVKGPNFSLWNRYGRCRRLMCNSVVDFMAKAPGMSWHELLSAPWPDDQRPPPAWMTARRKD